MARLAPVGAACQSVRTIDVAEPAEAPIACPSVTPASGLVFEGPWALSRMFERAQIDAGSQPEKFRASFAIDDRRIQFEVTTSSVKISSRPSSMAKMQIQVWKSSSTS